MSNFLEESAANHWWLVLLQGGAILILGVLLITAPTATTAVLVVFLGVYWLISGIFSIIEIFAGDKKTHWGWLLAYGILGVAAGLVVLDHPLFATILAPTVLVFGLGILGVTMGILSLVGALKGGGWGAGILGCLNLIFGVILLTSPLVATFVLPLISGIFALIGGVGLMVWSFKFRKVQEYG